MSTLSRASLLVTPRPKARTGRAARSLYRRRPSAPPTARWDLAVAGDGDAEGCARVLDALDALPRAAWLALGRRVASSPTAGEWASAAAALDAVLRTRRLAVTAWLVRDAVEAAVQVAPRGAARPAGRRAAPPPDTAEERVSLEAARRAAAGAALARLAGRWLSPAHVAVLLAPLETTGPSRRVEAAACDDVVPIPAPPRRSPR